MTQESINKIAYLTVDLAAALKEIERLIAERDTLRTFAQSIMEAWPDGDVDGGWLFYAEYSSEGDCVWIVEKELK